MNAEDGLDLLGRRGWLASTPADFREAMLARSQWRRYGPGDPLTQGGKEADADVFGLAHGVLEMTTVFGAPDTPLTHLARPVYWFGYGPILSGKPRRASIIARSEVWLAQVSQRAIRELLAAHPQWWREFATIALEYGDLAANVAADLLIRNSERRCAAVLLRLGGCRF